VSEYGFQWTLLRVVPNRLGVPASEGANPFPRRLVFQAGRARRPSMELTDGVSGLPIDVSLGDREMTFDYLR